MPGRAYEEETEGQPSKSIPASKVLYLENEFLRAGFMTSLGWPFMDLIDRRTERGVAVGLAFTASGERPAPAPRNIRAALGEDFIMLADAATGDGLGWQMRASLGEGATLDIELTVRNRTLRPVLWNPGITWSLGHATEIGGGVIVADEALGCAILAIGSTSTKARTRFPTSRTVAPRWGETFLITLVPLSGIGRAVAASKHAVVTMTEAAIRIEPTEPMRKAKLVLLSASDATMEATADLDPTSPLEYTFSELGGEPKGLIILDADRNEMLRYVAGDEPVPPTFGPEWSWDGEPTPDQYPALDVEPATRYWAALLRTRDAFLAGDFSAAAQHAETALLYNGDDPLTWIEKAIALRHLGEDDPQAPELPNVHFLAPLEPMARAESFLRGGDSPLMLEALADHPEELIEAACHYMSLGLTDDAARFLAGAIEVCDRPMLRYLYAACALQGGEMRAEAAAAVSAAARLGLVEPWPWRPVERDALARLVEAFPADLQIPQYFTRSNGPDSSEAC